MLGTSGQPLHDMCLYVPDPEEEEDAFDPRTSLRLSLMKMTLQCRHLAPTAPDTLHCFPYKETDPFTLKITPHLCFHGDSHALFATLPLLTYNQATNLNSRLNLSKRTESNAAFFAFPDLPRMGNLFCSTFGHWMLN
jgi:hypothetical protein